MFEKIGKIHFRSPKEIRNKLEKVFTKKVWNVSVRVLVETVFTEIYPISISLLSVSGKLNTSMQPTTDRHTNLKDLDWQWARKRSVFFRPYSSETLNLILPELLKGGVSLVVPQID